MILGKRKTGDNNTSQTSKKMRRNKTYKANERKLHKVTYKKISKRQFSTRTCELYREAGITKPTFYLHHPNCTDVRDALEDELFQQFEEMLSCNYEKRHFFVLLVDFVVKNKQYFCAALKGSDHYLLTKIILKNRDRLVSKDIGDRVYCLYARKIQLLIDNWLEFEELTPAAMDRCVKQLKLIRLVRHW